MRYMLGYMCVFGILVTPLNSEMINVKAVFPGKDEKQGATRLVLTRSLPDVKDLTVCHWISSAGKLKPKGSYTVSYASGKASDEFLLGFVPTADTRVQLQVSVRDQSVRILTNMFRLGQWHHVCVTWSSGSGRVTGYIDGQKIGTVDQVQQGASIRAEGVLVLGQDQDIFNGKFDDDEAWEGSISDFQMWDEVLKEETISNIAQCKFHLDGNLVSWLKTPFRSLNGVVLSEVHLCKKLAYQNLMCK